MIPLMRAACFALLSALALPAQVVLSGAVGAPTANRAPDSRTFSGFAKLGIALPPAPHLLLLWNMVGVGFDRLEARNGVSVESGFEAWVSPSARPAQSHGPLLLTEAALGRRFGEGLHGYASFGIGGGWSIGDWVPYAEFRRRSSFHAGRPVDHQIVIGIHFVLFG